MAKNDFIAWSPDGFSAPIELLAVLVSPGEVTEQIWIDALSDRVLALVEREPNPKEAAEWACKALECPVCESPSQLGLSIVRNNLKLLSAIHESVIDEFPFPNFGTKESLEARNAIQGTDLEAWVGYAEFLMNGIKLATYTRSSESPPPEVKNPPDDCSAGSQSTVLKPYIDFINKHEIAICDPHFTNPDVFTVIAPKYDFSYSLTHQYQWISLLATFRPSEDAQYALLSEFEESIKNFNEKHATKVSCIYDEKKPFFFKPIYKPSMYVLKVEAPLSKDPLEINKLLTTFYGDILYFFNCRSFSPLISEAKSKRGSIISFPVFLEKLIEHLDLLKGNIGYEGVFDLDL